MNTTPTKPKRLVLIGGCGLIGHSLALSLKAHNHEVTCIDSLTVNNLLTIKKPEYRAFAEERLKLLDHAGIPLIRLDARDYQALSPTIAHYEPDVIVHLAAVAHITVANEQPYMAYDNSVHTLHNSMDVARNIGCGLMYFSSSTVYGDFSQPVIDETEELTPTRIYGNQKAAGELLVKSYNQTYDMPAVIIRPQALYGPRCVSGRVTQLFAEQAIRGEPIEIHGDGTEEHDFTYIDDLVQGLRLALTGLDYEKGMLKTYNLTGESATSLQRLADIITARFPTEVIHKSKDPDKPSRGTMSCKRIRDDLGYEPQFDIERGMDEYLNWYESAWGLNTKQRA